MLIGGLQRCSTIDFPGRIACVIFTQGCGLNCFYCHNRPLIRANRAQTYDESMVKDFLKRRVGKLEGVVISGGEPTLQQDLVEFAYYINSMGYEIKLDTNGQCQNKISELISTKLVDYFAIDIKASAENSEWVCGDKDAFDKAKSTVTLVADSNVDFEVRTTLYPGLDMDGLLSLVGSIPNVPRYRLNYFRMPDVLGMDAGMRIKEHALTRSEVLAHETELRNLQKNIII